MSLLKQKRVKSASIAAQNNKLQKKKRYDNIQTESSQSFKPPQGNRQRTYSRQSLRKAGNNRGNVPSSKEPQQMIEQNMNLKVFINNLQQQLSLQRGRLQMNKRKTQKYVKQFNRQFDKQLYYSGKNPHSYMFSGIKQQYQNIKRLYEMKCIQVDRYAQSIDNTNIQELVVFVQALQEENTLLRQKLQEILQDQPSSFQKGHMKQKHSQIDKLYYNEVDESQELSKQSGNGHQFLFQQKSDTTQTAYYKTKAQDNQKELNQLKKKISFLQKLIIEKDNNAHKAKRQSKRLEKQRSQYQEQIKKLQYQINQIEKVSENKIQSILEQQIKRFEKESEIFKRSLIEKDNQIAKLQKQIRFLSTMLSYWKPLDEIHHNDFLARNLQDKQEYFEENKGKKAEYILKQSQPSQRQVAFDSINHNTVENQHELSFKSNRQEDFIRKTAGIKSQSQQNVKVTKERVPQSCSKKSKLVAIKCRKVQPYQIKSLGELLRYRLIGHNFSVQKLRKLFDLNEDVMEQDKEFRTQYITMRQIKNVFQGAPFYLNELEAVLVSRYVVEDEACQYVYLDQDNQIKRTIAKSIIKALIGEYELPSLQQMARQWQKLKIQYLPNIQSALKIIAPKGIITEAKFIQLLVGLGIQLKDDFKDWMIAMMVVKSQSLKELKYRTLIPE